MAFTLLKDGRVFDGLGGEPFDADVLIENDRVAAIGRIPANGHHTVLDCQGLALSPGFIDLHSHSDLQVLDNRTEKIEQGVTTEVVGNCGFSAYPCGTHAEEVREFANGIFCGGDDWSFRDARDYLDALEKRARLLNVQSLVGHGALRVALFGNRQDRLDSRDIDRMAAVLADALAGGACGFSTGLMYAPGSSAGTDELEALCRVVARSGKLYTTHMRSYSWQLLESVSEQLDLARSSGCRLQISHLQAVGRSNWDKQRRALALIEAASHEGVDVEFDIYPYVAGSTVLTQLLPQWVLDGGTQSMLARIHDSTQRPQIRKEVEGSLAQNWSDIYITAVASTGNQVVVGKTLANVAASRGIEAVDAMLDLLSEESGSVNIISFNQSEENLRELLTHPLCSVITDGFYVKGRPHPRLFGTFPHLLGSICRDRAWMKLPEAIHKITAKPAARLGMSDRGVLRAGAIADITVFDPVRISGPASYEQPDLKPLGIRAVLRSGRVVSPEGHTRAD